MNKQKFIRCFSCEGISKIPPGKEPEGCFCPYCKDMFTTQSDFALLENLPSTIDPVDVLEALHYQ
jgi:hypothetical protein